MNKNDAILFVDDDRCVLAALRRLLVDEPYEVRTCDDPELALGEIAADPPAVLVSDFYMPKMHGPELLHRVRKIDDSILRLILTGKPDVTAVLDAVQEGAVYRFLLKPWDGAELKMSLRKALEHHRLLAERCHLVAQVRRQEQVMKSLEAQHPGITKLPAKDESGAFVLAASDLPGSG